MPDNLSYGLGLWPILSSGLFDDEYGFRGAWCPWYAFLENSYSIRNANLDSFLVAKPRDVAKYKGPKPVKIPFDGVLDHKRFASPISEFMRFLSQSGLSPDFLRANNQVMSVKLNVDHLVPLSNLIYRQEPRDIYGEAVPAFVGPSDGSGIASLFNFSTPGGGDYHFFSSRPFLTEISDALTRATIRSSRKDEGLIWLTGGDSLLTGGSGGPLYGYGIYNLVFDRACQDITWTEYYYNIFIGAFIIAECRLRWYETNQHRPATYGGYGMESELRVSFTRNSKTYYANGDIYSPLHFETDRSVTLWCPCFVLAGSVTQETLIRQYKKLTSILTQHLRDAHLDWRNIVYYIQPLVESAYEKGPSSLESWIENIYEHEELIELVPSEKVLSAIDNVVLRPHQSFAEAKAALERLRSFVIYARSEYKTSSSLRLEMLAYLGRLAAAAADIHLLISFGILPALGVPEQLEVTLRKLIESFPLNDPVRVRTSKNFAGREDLGITHIKTAFGVTLGGFRDPSTESFTRMYSLGILPTPSRVWKCVKYSFLADYFIRMSSRMSLVEAWFMIHTLQPRDVIMSWKWTKDPTTLLKQSGFVSLKPSGVEETFYVRMLSNYVPYTFWHNDFGRLFPTRINVGIVIALLIQAIKSVLA